MSLVHSTKKIFKLSHSHVLNIHKGTYEDEFIEYQKLAKGVLEYDAFRKISEFSLEYTENPREKRESHLPTSLQTNNYEDYLLKNPKKRKQIFLKQHVLFIDFVRKKYNDNAGGFDFRSNLPENRFANQDRIEFKETAAAASIIISTYATIQEIPIHLQNENIREITNNMTLLQALIYIRSNIKIMKKLGLSNSEFIVYIITYFMFLQEFTKIQDKLSAEEYKLLIDIIDEIEILYLGVQVNLSNEKLATENSKLKLTFKTANEQKESYFNVLNRYEKVDILFINTSNPIANRAIINQILSEVKYTFEIKLENNNYAIYSSNPNELMSIYKLLYEYYISNSLVFVPLLIIKPDGVKVDTLETHCHTIETKSTLWSYVFFKLYGPGVRFSKDRDNTVKAIIKLSEVNNIPLRLLLPKTNEAT